MNKYATKEDVTASNTDQLRNLISNHTSKCKSIKIITGFLTKKGFTEFVECIGKENIKKVKLIIVGVYTSSAQKAFEYISSHDEYSHIKLFVFNKRILSDSNLDADVEKLKFTPILHAKIIAGYDNEIAWAYTGSANITDYAFNDKNIESGIFLTNNILLKSVDLRIKKISDKKNLLKFDEIQNNIFCLPCNSDPDIYFISNSLENNYKKIQDTYLIFVKSSVNNRPTNIIGVFSKDLYALSEKVFQLSTKIILIFNDAVIEPTIVTAPSSERDILKDSGDINFYINRKSDQKENGFFIEDNYKPDPDNRMFVILENKNNPKTIEEYKSNETNMDLINNLFKINLIDYIAPGLNNVLHDNLDYRKNIIIEPAKQKIILDQQNLKDGIFNMNHFKISLIKKEVSLFDLMNEDDRLNNPIPLNIKIK